MNNSWSTGDLDTYDVVSSNRSLETADESEIRNHVSLVDSHIDSLLKKLRSTVIEVDATATADAVLHSLTRRHRMAVENSDLTEANVLAYEMKLASNRVAMHIGYSMREQHIKDLIARYLDYRKELMVFLTMHH